MTWYLLLSLSLSLSLSLYLSPPTLNKVDDEPLREEADDDSSKLLPLLHHCIIIKHGFFSNVDYYTSPFSFYSMSKSNGTHVIRKELLVDLIAWVFIRADLFSLSLSVCVFEYIGISCSSWGNWSSNGNNYRSYMLFLTGLTEWK